MPFPHWILPGAGLLVSLFIGIAPSSAQSLEGYVRTQDRLPLPGAQISVADLGYGAVSNADGYYRLGPLPTGEHAVEYRFLGFARREMAVSITGEETVRLDVVLTPATVQVEGIVVTAENQAQAMLKRGTRSVSVLEGRALEPYRGQSLGEALEQLPGVTTLSTGPTISKPVIRGLHSERVVVLNRGVVQEGQQWGGEHAPAIDPFTAARIEVVKGAAGVEYGVGAIGGVIRVEPPDLPFGEPTHGKMAVQAFSNNRQGTIAAEAAGGLLSRARLGWRVHGTLKRAGDSRTPRYVIRNSGFTQASGSAEVGYEGTRTGWHASVNQFSTRLGLYKGAHIGNYDDLLRAIERGEPSGRDRFSFAIDPPMQTVSHTTASLRGHLRLPAGHWLELQYAWQYNSRSEYDAHRRFAQEVNRPAFSLGLTTQSLEIKLRQHPRGKWLGVMGITGMNQSNLNGQTGQLIPNFRALTAGIFARQTWVSGPWTLEGGVRLDGRWLEAWPRASPGMGSFMHRRHHWSSLTTVLGAIWQFSDHWSLSTNLGSAWRPPGVSELYNFGVHHGTAQFEVGRPDLGSENSLGLDATLRHRSEGYTLEVSAYQTRISDYIYLTPEAEPRVTIRGSFPSFRYTQTDARLRGLDGSLQINLGGATRLGGGISVVRGRDLALEHHLIGMPADRVSASLAQDFGSHLTVSVHTRLVARQSRVPEALDYAPPPSGYRLFGLDLYWTPKISGRRLQASLSASNLLNVSFRDYLSRFRYFIDNPGRSVSFRLSVPVGTPPQSMK